MTTEKKQIHDNTEDELAACFIVNAMHEWHALGYRPKTLLNAMEDIIAEIYETARETESRKRPN